MTQLLHLSTQIERLNSELARYDRLLSDHQESYALRALITSMAAQRDALEVEFLESTREFGLDVCRYRLFQDSDTRSPLAAAIGRSLFLFQAVVSTVYAVVKQNAPRIRSGNLPTDILNESTLQWGYAYPGSVGLVLLAPREWTLFGESKLDEAMDLVFKLAALTSPEMISSYVPRVGPGTVRTLYAWVAANAAADIGTDIDWRRDDNTWHSVTVQPKEFGRLKSAIELTSDAEVEEYSLAGTLTAYDSKIGSFKFTGDNDLQVNGAFSATVSRTDPLKVPARYRLNVIKTTRVKYSTEADQVSWELTDLSPLDSPKG